VALVRDFFVGVLESWIQGNFARNLVGNFASIWLEYYRKPGFITSNLKIFVKIYCMRLRAVIFLDNFWQKVWLILYHISAVRDRRFPFFEQVSFQKGGILNNLPKPRTKNQDLNKKKITI
jgi:hypothetical protein